ncbi:MAG TPA: iron-containing alcohol dehydrogenase [Planctomycetaceae bacterium]|nr:iron-containing alcohol dehydrogenase [Planctomycetaceae bacterium]HIQ21848.1 iron-containing alcohol dehydrogenase [Planctomycetota bacterium]
MEYEFVAPRRIVFGWGSRRRVGELARGLGNRAFILCGSRTLRDQGVIEEITTAVQQAGAETVLAGTLSREPYVEDVDRVVQQIRSAGVTTGDFLLAVGGGAAIDLAKAVAAMATNDESPTVKDYLEGVGRNLELVSDPLPVLAMPTTAGTGSEATKNAVVSSRDPPLKRSIRDPRLVPRIALVDPELTVSVPPRMTAASGMDAITQLVESYLSRKAKPIPRALAVQGLKLAVPSLAEAVNDGTAREAREKMAHAALLSGMALTNSGLGLAHGVAPALGIHLDVPHGVACALLLPVALEVNRSVCQDELAQLCEALFGRGIARTPEEAAAVFIGEIERLCDRVGVPRRLSQVGVTAGHIPDLVRSASASSMSGNPRPLSEDQLAEILERWV